MKFIIEINDTESIKLYTVWSVSNYELGTLSKDIKLFSSDDKEKFNQFIRRLHKNSELDCHDVEVNELFEWLTTILSELSIGKKYDPSWIRPRNLTYKDRKNLFYEAKAIIEKLKTKITKGLNHGA